MADFGELVGQPAVQGGQDFYQAAVPMPPQQQPFQSNLDAAHQALNLTPQERALYERHLTNLTGPGGVDNAPTPDNPQGSRSTLFQTSIERGGKHYNIPTVWDGKILAQFDDKGKFTGAPEAEKRAEAYGLDKFPSYNSEAEAEARYQQMHQFMDQDTAQYLKAR